MKALLHEIAVAAAESPRMFFTPVVGAVKAVILECRPVQLVHLAVKNPDTYQRQGH
jgi:hypothetical protein